MNALEQTSRFSAAITLGLNDETEVNPINPIAIHRCAPGSCRDDNDRIYLVGGFRGHTALPSVERYLPRLRLSEHLPNLHTPSAFPVCIYHNKKILSIGGGTSIYRGGRCYKTIEAFDCNLEKWEQITGLELNEFRCGHSGAIDDHGNILIAGGYSGAMIYQNTCELLPAGWDNSSITRFVKMPVMNLSRTGSNMVYGPDRSFYVLGTCFMGVS